MKATHAIAPLAPSIIKATASDAPVLIEMLSRAFDKDPLTTWFVRSDADRAEAMRRLFRISLEKLTLPFGEVFTTPERTGAALWTPPGKWKLPWWKQLFLAPQYIRCTGFSRAWGVIRAVDVMQRHQPKTPNFYLYVLGVEPECQGTGIGSALLQPMLSRCDISGTGAYVETSNERNLPLYLRHGFEPTGEISLPHSGPTLWLLWRSPRR